MKTYPVFLVGLEDRRCVVVGGGSEAQRKIDGLLECDACITVIAAHGTARVRELAAAGRLLWIERDYRPGDLTGAFLVIAADQRHETNRAIWYEARARGVLANVMDDVEHCSFVAGSVVRRGSLTVAVSTGGCAPALAVRLRQRLQREFGPEYAEFLDLLAGLREPLARRFTDYGQRRKIWYRLVDSDILDHLRRGDHGRALETVERIAGGLDGTSMDAPPSTPPRASALRRSARSTVAE